MIPDEFVDFSTDFEVAFIIWNTGEGPSMGRTGFNITQERISIEPFEYDILRLPRSRDKVTLVFSNPYYTENCSMGIVKGILHSKEEGYELDPQEIIWTLSFDLDFYPERLMKRWKKT